MSSHESKTAQTIICLTALGALPLKLFRRLLPFINEGGGVDFTLEHLAFTAESLLTGAGIFGMAVLGWNRWAKRLEKEPLHTKHSLILYAGFAFCLALFLVNLSIPGTRAIDNFGSREGSIYENLTVILLLVGAVTFAFSAYREPRTLRKITRFFATFLLVIGAGEEISWGQHLLGFATPESIAEVNAQGEFSLHNHESINSRFDTIVLALFAVYFVAYPLLAKAFRTNVPRIVVDIAPMPPLLLGIVYIIAASYTHSPAWQFLWDKTTLFHEEIREVYLAGMLALLASADLARQRDNKRTFRKSNTKYSGAFSDSG